MRRDKPQLARRRNHHDDDRLIGVNAARKRAGIQKRVTLPTLRHSVATHMLGAGADLHTIQVLLGHAELADTFFYLHLSHRHLQAVGSRSHRDAHRLES